MRGSSQSFAHLMLLALACAGATACDAGGNPASSPADGAIGADTSAQGDTTSTADGVTPAACSPRSGDPNLIRMRGTVFTGDILIPDGEVFTSAVTGQVLCVSTDCSSAPGAAEATVLCTDGIITPGLINPHDHGTYNHLPRWKHTQKFNNRYQWQANQSYKDFKKGQASVSIKAKCENIKWTELRELVSGVTAIQGVSSSVGACAGGWIRNLDDTKGNAKLPGYLIETQVTKIAGAKDADVAEWTAGMDKGTLTGLVFHVAEGIDKTSKDEWYDLVGLGLARPRVGLIHATGLTGVELAEARQNGISIIWSPQSNLDLYGDTTRIPAALNLGLNVAIGPDWTPSGSMNPLDELKCAKQLSDKRWGGALTDRMLVEMVTAKAAEAVGAEEWIGRLGTGYQADVAVFAGDRSDPFGSVVRARPETVRLTMVAGKVLYGDTALVQSVTPSHCEAFDACGVQKTLCAQDPTLDKGTLGYEAIKSSLLTALANAKAADAPSAEYDYAYELWPLFFCGQAADALISCDVTGAAPSADDSDGDGKANSADNCPAIWNPDQGNLDADAAGDACDVCPLVADATTCAKPGPTDTDGDGVPNTTDNCKSKANTDQTDTDKDGKGDVCDPCPDKPNPADAECPVVELDVTTVNQDTVGIVAGDKVRIKDLQITAVSKANPVKIWAQKVPGAEWGGILIELPKGQSTSAQVGQKVTATGVVASLFGLRALQSATLELGDVASAPVEPVVVPVGTLAQAPSAVAWRSVLVEVALATVEATNADADAGDDFGELLLAGGLRVDDLLIKWGTDLARPAAGTAYSKLRGILYYSFGQEKLIPRSAADFVQ